MNDTSFTWLTAELKNKIRKLFEPRYGRRLTDFEVVEIAENLTLILTIFLEPKNTKEYTYGKNC